MSRQNRVTPTGDLIAISDRGQFMGNRGILHDDQGELTAKRWTHKQWIICHLKFKGRKRQLMSPGCYTELFFLDEATALAAGHRPCCECNRERYSRFKAAWLAGNPEYGFGHKVSIREIDKVIHSERVDMKKKKVTWKGSLKELPEGTFVALSEAAHESYLIHGNSLRLWTPAGYGEARDLPSDHLVVVLTPKSTVRAISAGFRPLFD